MEGVAWRWQRIDGATFKAPLAQEAVGPNPTDRGKKGSKRHLLVDGRGVPLSLVVTGANVNDLTKLDDVLIAIVVKRAQPTIRRSKHLCPDAGYRSKAAAGIIESHGYILHVVDRRQEKERKRRDPPRRLGASTVVDAMSPVATAMEARKSFMRSCSRDVVRW